MHLAVWILIALAGLAVFARWLEPRLAFFPFPGEDATPREFGVAYEAVTIDTSDGERLRGWVMTAPTPRARIVYFQGNGGNLSNWAPILVGIVKRGYSVLAIDYRGFGMSTGRPTERGLYLDVDAALAHAWNSTSAAGSSGPAADAPLIYWGRSLGGTMAAHGATVRHPDGLILESAFPDARAVVRGSPVLMALSLFATYRFPTAEFVNRTTMPVLVMHGDRDSVIPFPLGRELFSRIREPKTFVVIAGGDHNDAAAPDANAYWAAIDGFVAHLAQH
jgi:fermentation-respiration switch protein FrsA (DUF1100 family)